MQHTQRNATLKFNTQMKPRLMTSTENNNRSFAKKENYGINYNALHGSCLKLEWEVEIREKEKQI